MNNSFDNISCEEFYSEEAAFVSVKCDRCGCISNANNRDEFDVVFSRIICSDCYEEMGS